MIRGPPRYTLTDTLLPYSTLFRSTPARVALAWRELFAGYAIDPAALLARTFTESAGYEDTITLRSIPVVSTCEHHLAPITGVAHVAYRPGASVVGISKLSRLVDAYARRLQLQERLTSQIARSEEHTSELQSLMRISYAVFCMKNNNENLVYHH